MVLGYLLGGFGAPILEILGSKIFNLEKGWKRSGQVFLRTAERGRPAKGRGKLKLSPLELRKNSGRGLTRLRHPADAADSNAPRIPPSQYWILGGLGGWI